MSEPKRHHYIPKLILRKFSENGKILCIDRSSGKYFFNNPDDQFFEQHLYSIETEQNRDASFEKKLSNFESLVGLIIRNLEIRNFNGDLDEKNICLLKIFISLQIRRNPHWSRPFGGVVDKRLVEDVLKEYESIFGKSVEGGVREKFLSDNEINRLRKNAITKAIFELSDDASKIIMNKSLIFGFASREYQFIVGDWPYVSFNIDGIGHKTNETWISISPNLILGLCYGNNSFSKIYLTRDQTRKYNMELFSKSRIVCSRNRTLLESLQKKCIWTPSNRPS